MKALYRFSLTGTALAQEALMPRERMLLGRIESLEQRLAALEAKTAQGPSAGMPVSAIPSSSAGESPRPIEWASSLGIENNYAKNQFNGSRSYWFSFLPYYPMEFRASYPLPGRLNTGYWLTSGMNQSEHFDGFKSQAVLPNFTSTPGYRANLNCFNG